MAGLFGWLEERTGLQQFRAQKKAQAVPAHMGFLYCFGGISFFIILLQVMTGLFMVFYYEPTPQEALRSIERMSNMVPFGGLFRCGIRAVKGCAQRHSPCSINTHCLR